MSKAFDREINKENMKFDSTAYFQRDDSAWAFRGGAYYNNTSGSEAIVMPINSSAHISRDFDDKVVSYIKLKLNLRDPGQQADTNGRHNVYGICKMTLEEIPNDDHLEENETPNTAPVIVYKTFVYYPKFVYEDGYVDDYTIVQVGDNYKLKNVKLSLFNYDRENQTIRFKKTGLYLCFTIDEETVKETVVDTVLNDTDINEHIDDKIQQYITSPSGTTDVQNIIYESGVVFPIYETMSGIPSDAPDGFACIVLNA